MRARRGLSRQAPLFAAMIFVIVVVVLALVYFL
jgi:hypothetical protein